MLISIIICSRQSQIEPNFAENIKQTIGCDYELIAIDNHDNKYSIFQAYTKGLEQSKGDILCFMHDDIKFMSSNWGRILQEHFAKYEKCGCIGIAGGHILPKCITGWSLCGICSVNIMQGKYEGNEQKFIENKIDSLRREPTIVASLDGVLLCFPKTIFEKIKWDTETFNGFHFYDTDICMQVNKSGYECHIDWDILLAHRSPGNANKSFFETGEKWLKKWENELPIVRGIELDKQVIEALNNYANLQRYYSDLEKSKQYKLGKTLMAPLTWLHKKIKKTR